MQSFTAVSGNSCQFETKGERGDLVAIECEWDHRPSQDDVIEFSLWYGKDHPEVGVMATQLVESKPARQAIIDDFLFGGQRN